MRDMDRTAVMKMPATVLRAEPLDAQPVVMMTAPYHAKADLLAAVTRLARRGEIRPVTARPIWNPKRGQWEWDVIRLYPPRPAWIRPAMIIGSVLIVLAILTGLLWWVLATLTAGALALFLLAALVTLAGIARAGKRQVVNINVSQR